MCHKVVYTQGGGGGEHFTYSSNTTPHPQGIYTIQQETFKREDFCGFRGFVGICEIFLRIWRSLVAPASNSQKLFLFFNNSQKFSPMKVSHNMISCYLGNLSIEERYEQHSHMFPR